ncbi:hypothetical protein ABK040_013207 [Willaertia magna]
MDMKEKMKKEGLQDWQQQFTSECNAATITSSITSSSDSNCNDNNIGKEVNDKKKKRKNIVQLAIEDTYEGYLEKKFNHPNHPFHLLYKCYLEKSLIKVYVNNRDNVTSECHGTLIGFDKYMNVMLENVTENYKELEIQYKKQKNIERDLGIVREKKRNRKRSVKVYIEKIRTFPILFIKGENIILISKSDGE